MSVSHRERIARGMELSRAALIPFAEREYKARFGELWFDTLAARFDLKKGKDGAVQWDTHALLKAIGDTWQEVFRHVLGHVERSYLGEMRDVRNRWAHEEPFSTEDTERALDTMKRLLDAISASEQADEVQKIKAEVQRSLITEQAKTKTSKQLTLAGMPKADLRPWRDVVTPHPDVASGRYMQAEFAADLAQVYRKEGSDEYRDPREFYRRTYITSGLQGLLVGALRRLSGKGDDPIVELQTNFGGGKTHSMLALYHLFGGTPAVELAGIDAVLKEAGVKTVPKANRAVLVGTYLSPAHTHPKPDGTVVHTLWGELAWQIGKAEGYAIVAESDKRSVSPGGDAFIELFKRFSPCIVLIDEWVAHARQIVGKKDLPAGDFAAQTTFAQALTEAAKAVDKTMVVASIPASKVEIGGDNGELALDTLKNVFERLGKAWRPATGDEGFEIVRRRLFQPITDKDALASRESVISAFSRMYKEAPGDFPLGCTEEGYRREFESAYPIHPELFHRLYEDWSTLDKFQRTRGVLRLLAKVIHRLWEDGDQSLMILPACVPMDDGQVKSELTRYLDDVWEPIISQDVDGERSLPLEIDRSTPTLGRVSACRRVARTLYMGTAPAAGGKNPGIDDRRVRLGCVQPGEPTGAFGDALRRLSDRAKYIHQDKNRYWLSTKPNLNRMAEDRANSLMREPETLHAEVEKRLQAEQKLRGDQRGDFAGVHACPMGPADVPDEPEARLVILPPSVCHRKGQEDSTALSLAKEIFDRKGSGPRLERNMLVFLAADKRELDSLMEAVAQHLAWKSILGEWQPLNLDPFHKDQAETKTRETDGTVNARISGAWIHALVPTQPQPVPQTTAQPTTDQPKKPELIRWEEIKVSGNDSLTKRTSNKLKSEEMLMPKMGGIRLRMELDRYLWTDKNHVSMGQLAEWFSRYLYLPRIKNRDTLVGAILDGAAELTIQDTFATAAAWDEQKQRYRGLKVGGGAPAVIEKGTLLVKPEVAQRQDKPSSRPPPAAPQPGTLSPVEGPLFNRASVGVSPSAPSVPRMPNLFVGSVRLDGNRVGRDAGRVAEEVIQHLSTLPGAEVEVTLEIRVKAPDGVKDDTIRTVSENANTLKFKSYGFERE